MPRPLPALLAFAALALPACGPTIRPSYDSPEPAARNAAIVRDAKAGKTDDLAGLVRMLESDDPATRVLAITTLDRLTGQRFGYDHTAKDYERARAVARWREYVAKSERTSTR